MLTSISTCINDMTINLHNYLSYRCSTYHDYTLDIFANIFIAFGSFFYHQNEAGSLAEFEVMP